jgi:hypothetical protein
MSLRKWTVQPLPRAAEHLGDGGLETGVGVGDDQLDTFQPASAERSQERPPERFGLGLTDVQTNDLPPSGLVHAVGDHQRLVAHPTGFADPFDLGVQPQIRVGAGQRPLPEHGDLLVQPAAEPADGVLAHLLQAELGDQPFDLAGRDPVDVGLLDDRD